MHAIAVYARASRDKEDKRISVDRQVERCTAKANQLWPDIPVAVYKDNNRSGADENAKREDYDRLIDDIRSGHVIQVVTNEQSRLTRRPDVWQQLVVTLNRAGIDQVHTPDGPISVAEGNSLVAGILNLVDAEEVQRVKRRTRAMHAQLAIEGRPAGGRMYGYRHSVLAEDGKTWVPLLDKDGRPTLVVEPDEAAVVRRIIDRLIDGHAMTAVAAELNRDSVPTPRDGKLWRVTTVRAIVQRPTIAGLRVHNGNTTTGLWQPIIDEQRWRKALRALGAKTVTDRNGKPWHRPNVQRRGARRWLLTGGLARCSLCGAALKVTGNRDYGSYCCHSDGSNDDCGKVSVSPAALVEEIVVGWVLGALDNPRLEKRLLEDPDPKRAGLLAELAAATEDMRQVSERKEAGRIDWETFDSLYDPAKMRADSVRAALAALPDPDVELPPADEIRARWDEMTLRQKRKVLDRFLEKVEVLPATRKGRTNPPAGESKRTVALRRVEARIRPHWRA